MNFTLEKVSPQAAIHNSDMGAFLACRRRWNWASALRENYEPRISYAPFFIGRAIHQLLEDWHRDQVDPRRSLGRFLKHDMKRRRMDQARALGLPVDGDLPPLDLWIQERNDLREQVKLIRGLIDHYLLWTERYDGPFADKDLEFLSHERTFRVPIFRPRYDAAGGGPYDGHGRLATRDTWGEDPRMVFEGRFDGLVRRKSDGTIWLWEVKTSRSIKERIGMLPTDMQATAYCQAAQQMFGEPVEGVIYTIIRKKLPAIPQMTSNGLLSRNKAIDTSAAVFLREVRRVHGTKASKGFIMSNYGDIIQSLLERESSGGYEKAFFARVGVRRTPEEQLTFSSSMWHVANDMVRDDIALYPNPGYHCTFCSFKEPCRAMMEGRDHQSVLDADFRQREHLYETEDIGPEE